MFFGILNILFIGKLYIICELCEYGNLRSHLRSERNTFVNLVDEKTRTVIDPLDEVNAMSTKDLVKWVYEIACGMEFLSNKKVAKHFNL